MLVSKLDGRGQPTSPELDGNRNRPMTVTHRASPWVSRDSVEAPAPGGDETVGLSGLRLASMHLT